MKLNHLRALISSAILTLTNLALAQTVTPITTIPAEYKAINNVAAENNVILVDAWKSWRESEIFVSKDAGATFTPLKKFPNQWGRILKDGDKLFFFDTDGIARVNANGELEEPLQVASYVDSNSIKIHKGIAYGFNRGSVYIMEKGQAPVEIVTGVRELYDMDFLGNTLVLTSTSGIVAISDLGKGKVTTFLYASGIFMEYGRKLLAADDKLFVVNHFGDVYVMSQASIEAGQPEMLKHIEDAGGCTSMLFFNGKLYINEFGYGHDQPSKPMTVIDSATLSIVPPPFRDFRMLTTNGSYLLGGDSDGLSQIIP